jgi:hypothetical protein
LSVLSNVLCCERPNWVPDDTIPLGATRCSASSTFGQPGADDDQVLVVEPI